MHLTLEELDFLPLVNDLSSQMLFTSHQSLRKYLLSAYSISSKEDIAVNKPKTAFMKLVFWGDEEEVSLKQ